jgi:hypothetical protein
MNLRIPRYLLERHFAGDKRMIAQFEEMNNAVVDTQGQTVANVAATELLQDATVIVLSSNGAFTNERVLKLGDGLEAVEDGTFVTVSLKDVARSQDYGVTFIAEGDSQIFVPLAGTMVTFEHAGDKLGNYASDAAAAAGNVPIGGLYHNAGAVRVRLT